MGTHITVYKSDRTTDDAYFSGWAASRQSRTYGISYVDCITYGPDGDESEMFGPIRGEVGRYRPRVGRCIERCKKLLEAANANPSHPQDVERVSDLLRCLEALKADRKAMMSVCF